MDAQTVPEGRRVLVTGAAGAIGHHLVHELVRRDNHVRAVDIVKPHYQPSSATEFVVADLRQRDAAAAVTADMDEVYMLAANMGGIGYIERQRGAGLAAEIARDNTLIDLNTLESAKEAGVARVFFASSSCVYPVSLQEDPDAPPLKEHQDWPANPEDGYGTAKLYTECLCRYYSEDHGMETRVARFFNIYGPQGAWIGGREKAVAAMCRKIAVARDGDYIEVWGDGSQKRSFCYVTDCVDGILRVMRSDRRLPFNIGSENLVTINELAQLVARVAGKQIGISHKLDAPQGVRTRDCDDNLARQMLGWKEQVSLEQGVACTYRWILDQTRQAVGIPVP